MSGIQAMTAATISGALIFGMTLALLGRLKLAAAQSVPGQDGSFRPWLLSLNISLIPLVPLSGVLIDRYGARPVLVAGSAMVAVALVVLKPKAAPLLSLAAMLLAGFGVSALGTASTVLMPRAFFVSEETAAGLNLGFVFIALGALLTVVLADILLKMFGLRRTLAGFALIALAPAFLGVLSGSTQWHIPQQPGNPSELFAEPGCWLAALVLFFYVPLEAAISLWTVALLVERGHEEGEATGLLAGFWAAFLASRLLVALAQHMFFLSEGWNRWLIVAAPLLASVLLGNLAGAGQHGRLRGGLILLGLLLGPVLPTVLSLLFQVAADAEGTAFGLVFAAGSFGSILFAPFIKPRSASRSPLSAGRLPILLAVMVWIIAGILALMMPYLRLIE